MNPVLLDSSPDPSVALPIVWAFHVASYRFDFEPLSSPASVASLTYALLDATTVGNGTEETEQRNQSGSSNR